jgi:formylglycine-generating enzyme required for sulfatase activity
MPEVELLPAEMKGLADRQAEFVDYRTFDHDVRQLIRKLRLAPLTLPGPIIIDIGPNGRSNTHAFVPGNGRNEWFTDHPQGPEMVLVPAGSFIMGSPENEPERQRREGPQHRVTIMEPFAVARHAITRGQFSAFVDGTNYMIEARGAHVSDGGSAFEFDPKASWRNPGFLQDNDQHPVVCVNPADAKNLRSVAI